MSSNSPMKLLKLLPYLFNTERTAPTSILKIINKLLSAEVHANVNKYM